MRTRVGGRKVRLAGRFLRIAFLASACIVVAACASTISGNGHVGVVVSSTSTRHETTATSRPAPSVSFHGVSVTNADDLRVAPDVSSRSSEVITELLYQDLVVGAGGATTPTSTVTVQYVGVLYRDGSIFDSSWDRNAPATFALPRTVQGFQEGIGGTGDIPAMRVGGRRLMILPARLAYGAQGTGPIPPDATLVFVVDLVATA